MGNLKGAVLMHCPVVEDNGTQVGGSFSAKH